MRLDGAIGYDFVNVASCNMCRAPVSRSRVLGRRMNCSQGIRPVSKIGIATTVMKCRECELIFSNPVPVPIDLSQHYGVPPESYWAGAYFELDEEYFLPQIHRYLHLSGKSGPGLRALDIGCGIGKCMKALENAGFEAFGVEPSRPFYERAVERMGVARGQVQTVRLEDAVFESNYFDFITFGAVLEHLYNPSESISRALQWTKPGGLIHIEVPSSRWLTNRIANLVYAIQGLDYVSNISPMHRPFHLYEFGLKSFEANSAISNYEIAHHAYLVCSTYLPRALDFLVKPFMAATNTGMQLEIWLRKRC